MRVYDNASARAVRYWIGVFVLGNLGSLAGIVAVHAPTHIEPTWIVADILYSLCAYIYH